jgi:hypothetical protein
MQTGWSDSLEVGQIRYRCEILVFLEVKGTGECSSMSSSSSEKSRIETDSSSAPVSQKRTVSEELVRSGEKVK